MKANEFLTRDNVTLCLPLSNVMRVYYGDESMLVQFVEDKTTGKTFLLNYEKHIFAGTFQELKRVIGAGSLRVVNSDVFGYDLFSPDQLSGIFMSVSWEQEQEMRDVQQFYKIAQL